MMASNRTPMTEVIPGQLFLGSEFDAGDRQLLKRHGITHVLTVELAFDPPFPDEFQYKVVAVEDCTQHSLLLKSQFDSCIEFIDNALVSHNGVGGRVLVHCGAGASRSPTVVAAYLISKKSLAATEALNSLKRLRPIVDPNDGFVQALHKYQMEKFTQPPRE